MRQLLAGGAAMVAVGAAWPLLIALTPAGSRPWVSGTSDNSILSLILGYNGVGRLSGQAGGPAGGPGGGGGGGGGVFGGPAGVFRLLDSTLGAQAGWLLGFALVGGVAIVVGSRLRRADARTGWLIATGGAFLACAVAFSAAQGIFHPYYVSLLAPFTAALVGGGVGQFLRGERTSLWLAPVAVVIGGVVELVVLNNTDGSPGWARALIIATGIVAVVAMVAESSKRVRTIALAIALAGLLAAPATWAAQTLGHATNGTFPAGGPVTTAGFGGPGRRARRTPRLRAGRSAPERRRPEQCRAGERRRRHVRRQLGRAHLRARLRGGPRRRHDRGLEPDGRGLRDHRLGRRRRRHRRLLRPRERGQRGLAEGGGQGRAHPLGAGRRQHGHGRPAGRPHGLADRHELGPEQRHGGLRRALRPLSKLTGSLVILAAMDNGSAPSHRVLVVDDEPNIVDVIAMALRFQGFTVESAGTGQAAIAAVSEFKPDLIVLDVMLPDMEGFDVAKRLGAQRGRVPIIFLTARDATDDKIRGLTLGGDDYVTKPFSLEELVARIRSILRRSGLAEPESSRLVFEDLELDEDAHEVMRGGSHVDLTATEYRLLRYLMLNPRRVLTRAQLLEHVWDYDFGGDARVLETYVSYLRRKLDVHGPPLIHTVRGVGYALRTPRA